MVRNQKRSRYVWCQRQNSQIQEYSENETSNEKDEIFSEGEICEEIEGDEQQDYDSETTQRNNDSIVNSIAQGNSLYRILVHQKKCSQDNNKMIFPCQQFLCNQDMLNDFTTTKSIGKVLMDILDIPVSQIQAFLFTFRNSSRKGIKQQCCIVSGEWIYRWQIW